MKINCSFLDNSIEITDDKINCIEIENKKYFYRLINDLNKIANGDFIENIICFDENLKEINLSNKLRVFIDFFNIDFNSKKYQNDINKYLLSLIDDTEKDIILKNYNKLNSIVKKIISKSELPLDFSNDISIDTIIKNFKILIISEEELFNNLLLLIDLEKILKTNKCLIFINLKQYLKKDELVEFYKYAIYNEVKLILIDSQSYGCCLNYEKKLIIDDNLDEFVI